MIKTWRELAWAILAVILAVVLAYGLILTTSEVQGESVPEVRPSVYDRKMLELERSATEAAFKDQIHHLFKVWMADGSDQPGRAVTGARKAQSAYVRIMTQLDKREQALPRP